MPMNSEITKCLVQVFTEEELDFVINNDIKYRVGLGDGSVEEDSE